ncbi:MAG: 3-deoxy-manno-octulosonate cytidylyltransferase [candidate division Zixibacteria bacterium]|nr:3-deoxy-manno-octulosonate cytidylyltransferase [candidate division Zixibacteria bacterium]
MRTLAVIPARLGSTRFPRKVLYPWQGQPLLYHVWRQVTRAKTVDRVVIATDSKEIEQAALGFGAEVVRTSAKCQTGTDRVAEAHRKLGGEIVINVQADSFNLSPAGLDKVVTAMKKDRGVQFATIARPITSDEELFDPNKVKVAVGSDGNALWFSRFPIPYIQKAEEKPRCRQFPFLLHIGIYFFRAAALGRYVGWPRTAMEKAESLEQLRILEHGGRIRLFVMNMKSVTIDSPADLTRLAGGGR